MSTESDLPLDGDEILHNLKNYRKVASDIIGHLFELKKTIEVHHSRVLHAKTSGTTIATVGTGLAVTGIVLAPFTLGTSLIVSSVGAVTSVGGAATNMITDLIDKSKREKYLISIQKYAEEQQRSKSELVPLLQVMDERILPFLQQGFTKSEALFMLLISRDTFIHDDENKLSEACAADKHCEEEDFEWIENPQKTWKPVKKFAFQAGINSLKLANNSQSLSSLAIAGHSSANVSMTMPMSLGRVVGTTALKTTMAAVGVVFASIDILSLVKDWKASDPTQETVDFVIDELMEEVKQLEGLTQLMQLVLGCKCFKGRFISDSLTVQTVLGSNPICVRVMIGHLQGDLVPSQVFYGSQQNTLHHQDLSKKKVKRKYRVGQGKTRLAVCGESRQSVESFSEVDIVTSLKHLFPPSCDDNCCDLIPINVFNQSVLSLNSRILERFLQLRKTRDNVDSDSSSLLNQLPPHSALFQDYHNPLSKHVETAIKTVLVAHVRVGCRYHGDSDGGYFDANQYECDMLLESLTSQAAESLYNEYVSMIKLIDEESDDDTRRSQFSQLVEVIINHKCFLDPVAWMVWEDADSAVYNDAMESVSNLFINLKFKIPLWACELCEVLH